MKPILIKTSTLLGSIAALAIFASGLQPSLATDSSATGESISDESGGNSASSEPTDKEETANSGLPTSTNQPPKELVPPPKKPRSALRFREMKPMPPQLIDFRAYDDVIKLTCEEKPNYLNFPSVKLTPIVKVNVSCLCNTKQNHYAPEAKYQELWFHKANPISCKHFTSFPIKERHEIGIFLNNDRRLSDAELTALASTLVRLRLETAINQNMIVTVRVPNESFERLKLELQKQNFVSYRENSLNITTLIPIPLETELGRRETLCFLSTR